MAPGSEAGVVGVAIRLREAPSRLRELLRSWLGEGVLRPAPPATIGLAGLCGLDALRGGVLG